METVKYDFLLGFGQRIKFLRQINGWTQRQLAEKCGYKSENSNSTINKIENGRTDVSVTKLIKFSEVFNVSTSYLMGEGDPGDVTEDLAKRKAISIMKRRLSDREQEELLQGLELYFQQKKENVN